MKYVDIVARVLVLVGALNWGLVGAFDFNLVEAIPVVADFAKWVYILVGVAALYEVYKWVTEMQK